VRAVIADVRARESQDGARAADAGEMATTEAGAMPADDDSGAREATAIPASWRRVAGNCGISMRAPALLAEPSRGVDSCVARFEALDCVLVADLGGFSNSLDEFASKEGYEVESVKVDDRPARLVTSNVSDGEQGYFLGIHFPPPLWEGASATLSCTITARCNSLMSRDTARLILQSARLPKSDGRTPDVLETTPCEGDDIRPITGYRLGRSCVEERTPVPGVCAFGAKAHDATGTGLMRCFVSSAGDYYWAHVAYGELIAGAGSRYGGALMGPGQPSQLTPEEEGQCTALVAALGKGTLNRVSGEPSYSPCW
jgi:hypothetical protein